MIRCILLLYICTFTFMCSSNLHAGTEEDRLISNLTSWFIKSRPEINNILIGGKAYFQQGDDFKYPVKAFELRLVAEDKEVAKATKRSTRAKHRFFGQKKQSTNDNLT